MRRRIGGARPARLRVLLTVVMTACVSGEAGQPGDSGSIEEGDVEFPSMNRPDVRGTHGAVNSDHPLASAAGYAVLKNGGNAVDAAVAMAGVLAVVRPHMNGVGGDAFALFYDGETGEVVGMNGSGRAGALATPTFFRAAGTRRFPKPDRSP